MNLTFLVRAVLKPLNKLLGQNPPPKSLNYKSFFALIVNIGNLPYYYRSFKLGSIPRGVCYLPATPYYPVYLHLTV
jgi:hypothetical protein